MLLIYYFVVAVVCEASDLETTTEGTTIDTVTTTEKANETMNTTSDANVESEEEADFGRWNCSNSSYDLIKCVSSTSGVASPFIRTELSQMPMTKLVTEKVALFSLLVNKIEGDLERWITKLHNSILKNKVTATGVLRIKR
ncbi:uncharacterized protein LOC142973679 [Anticarsia gemmatalis]|uniref:uncharacterized protein LOC142973679 n=1 Tax=Anticarsia gemmatalis TaxID=129554 RepID=UPI003F766016